MFPVKNQISSGASFPLVLEHLRIENINTTNHEESNDASLVLSFDFIDRSWLLMGDASINVEREIMMAQPSLDVDMFKVGHHGSRTSTSDAFISQITPDEAIISVGAKNYYNHPNDEVLAILSRHQVIIRRTDLEGTISYYQRGF